MTIKAYMDINVGPTRLGSLQLLLHDDTVPKTVLNFCKLLQRSGGPTQKGYKGCPFHRIIKGFMAQGGDFTKGDGTGGECIYNDGKSFQDENFLLSHDDRGILSMANSGPHTNGSQFFICFRPTPHLDGKHVVFGRVNLADEESVRVLDAMEKVQTNTKNDRPISPVTIVECGLVQDKNTTAASAAPETIAQDDDEIDLDDEDEHDNDSNNDPAKDQENETQKEIPTKSVTEVSKNSNDDTQIDLASKQQQAPPPEEEQKPKTKSQLLRERLRNLKMKNNQARQLNRQEVMREGERLGSEEGMIKERRRQAKQDKKAKQKDWESRNAKALEVGATAGIEGKFLVEQASDSLKNANRQAEKDERSRHDVRDYHNSEGQHRNYERNLQSLPAEGTLRREDDATSTFDPLRATMADGGGREKQAERDGARRLAHELQRRIDKQTKKKRNRLDFEATDVSYINERNKRFNKKIGRNFDEHTAEIRQNLERGTAL